MSNNEKVRKIWNDDEIAHAVGLRLIQLLRLTPDETIKGLYDTSRGYKTPAGVARVVLGEIELLD